MKWYHYIFLTFILAACSTKKSTTEEAQTTVAENEVVLTEAEMQTAGMAIGQPQKGTIASTLKVSGLVEVPPQHVVSISFPIGGYLINTRLMPGMQVRKGQALAEMQDQQIIQLQQDYLVARSKVSFLQKEYERQKSLNATKTTSDKVFEQTESEYRTQRILMNSLREKLRLIGINTASLTENNIRRSVMIYSPIDGYVSAVHVNRGKYVNPSDVLFELVNPKDVVLAVKVFEKDLPAISVGQPLKVMLVNVPEKEYEAEIALISKNLDDDRSALVHCRFLYPGTELLPGMYANAVIETKTHEAILVPEDAVVRWGELDYIFLQKGKDTFEMAAVNVGNTANGQTELQASGSILNQTVISKNAYIALMKLQNKAE